MGSSCLVWWCYCSYYYYYGYGKDDYYYCGYYGYYDYCGYYGYYGCYCYYYYYSPSYGCFILPANSEKNIFCPSGFSIMTDRASYILGSFCINCIAIFGLASRIDKIYKKDWSEAKDFVLESFWRIVSNLSKLGLFMKESNGLAPLLGNGSSSAYSAFSYAAFKPSLRS